MKTLLAFLVILFWMTPEAGCQPDIVVKNDILSRTAPDIDTLANISGKRLRFEFDTLYFVNQILIRDYLDVIKKYNELYETAGDMIDYMENFNKSIKTDLTSLTDNVDRSYRMIKDSLNTNNLRLDQWKGENTKLISINNQLNIDLAQVKQQMKNEQWNSFGKKMLYGGGGMVAGIGLSAIIVLISK